MALSKIQESSLDIGPVGRRRNLVINGDFRINQRDVTSRTYQNGSSNGLFTADRWKTDWSLNSNVTVEIVDDGPDGFEKSWKATLNTVGTDDFTTNSEYFTLAHRIEALNCTGLKYGSNSAQKCVVSFWVKANHTATYSAGFRANLTGGTHGNHRSFTIDQANVWEYKTLVFNGNTNYNFSSGGYGLELHIALAMGGNLDDPTDDGNWDLGNYIGLHSGVTMDNFTLTAGNTIQFTGVQVEVSPTGEATPFEHYNYAEELQLCYRYFYRNRADGGGDHNNVGIGTIASNDYVFAIVDLPTTMRTSPSVSYSALSDLRWTSVFSGSSGTPDSFGIGYAHATKPTLAVQKNGAGSGYTGQARLVGFAGTTTGYIDFDAEL